MNTHRVSKLKFYLADVEAFVEPLAVVPDIGAPLMRTFYAVAELLGQTIVFVGYKSHTKNELSPSVIPTTRS